MLVAFTSIPGVLGTPPDWTSVLLGLVLLAIGTGGIKPCVAAFGGDQFHPRSSEMDRALQSFFSLFYFVVNAASMIAIIFIPILRGDVQW